VLVADHMPITAAQGRVGVFGSVPAQNIRNATVAKNSGQMI
jgi:hypothetical protein